MKNSRILVTLMLISILIVSCSKDPNTLIVGEWKIADIASSEEISPDLKKALQETLDEMKASSSLVINADGTLLYTISEESTNGKWVLSPDAKTLTITYPDGNSEVSDIIELTDKKLVTSITMNEVKKTVTYEKQASKKSK